MATDYSSLKKGGFMRQKQKNTFSLRLRTIGGKVTADQLLTIANAAKTYGNAYVHLTSRQGIEIPFIPLEHIDAIKADLEKGNVFPGVCGPRVRTITACQGSEICPSGCIDTYTLAEQIDARYFGRELPHKFKFGITGCQNNCLKAEENDIGIKGACRVTWQPDRCIQCGVCSKVCREHAITYTDTKIHIDYAKCNACGRCSKSCPTDAYETKHSYIVSFGGTFGKYIVKGESMLPLIESEKTLFAVCDAAIGFFEQYANPGERFRFPIDRVGREVFEQCIKEAYFTNIGA